MSLHNRLERGRGGGGERGGGGGGGEELERGDGMRGPGRQKGRLFFDPLMAGAPSLLFFAFFFPNRSPFSCFYSEA